VSYQQIRPGSFQVLPLVIKNLIIINVLVYLAQITFQTTDKGWVTDYFALHQIQSDLFKPHQLITHMFMHGSWEHLFFNMFALWMFGSMLENAWNAKRFLIFYVLCGLGAAVLHLAWLSFETRAIIADAKTATQLLTPENLVQFFNKYGVTSEEKRHTLNILLNSWQSQPTDINFIDQAKDNIEERFQELISGYTVGASGAVFGCLAAFGYLFPNSIIFLFLFPIKAKWFVLIYAGIELWMGVKNSGGNVAHFAHLGGALIGFLLVLYWNKKNRKTFY
jgi:membrane associated rhomboid family serine protease